MSLSTIVTISSDAPSVKPLNPLQGIIKRTLFRAIPLMLIMMFGLLGLVTAWQVNHWQLGSIAMYFAQKRMFCERVRLDETILQPSNALTSLIFILLAMIAWFIPNYATDPHHFGSSSMTRWNVMIMFCFLGFGSFFWHATFTLPAYFADFSGMYMATTIAVAYHICRRYPGANPNQRFCALHWILFVLGFLARVLFQMLLNMDINDYITMGPLIIAYLLEFYRLYQQRDFKTNEDWRWLVMSLGSGILGAIFWVLDTYEIVCFPDAWLQLHGVWHVMTAYSALFFYVYANHWEFNSF